jgi:hypothetical protein
LLLSLNNRSWLGLRFVYCKILSFQDAAVEIVIASKLVIVPAMMMNLHLLRDQRLIKFPLHYFVPLPKFEHILLLLREQLVLRDGNVWRLI